MKKIILIEITLHDCPFLVCDHVKIKLASFNYYHVGFLTCAEKLGKKNEPNFLRAVI